MRVAAVAALAAWAATLGAQVTSYRGACDASAAVALDARHFVVASDEDDTLRIYERGHETAVGTLDAAPFLGAERGRESDIEGAAVVGARVYWITSHGRNAAGNARAGRQRFFATDIVAGSPPALVPVGRPYERLLDDLVADKALAQYRLADAARLSAEAEGGLNVEGLAATPDGRLLVGLRNPLSRGRALVIPLENPAALIGGGRARFGQAIELDLEGGGIRAMVQIASGYVLVAGPPADRGAFALYRWSGRADAAPVPLTGVDLGDLRPEALFTIPQTASVQLVSDDGGTTVGGVECKKRPAALQAFRSVVITP